MEFVTASMMSLAMQTKLCLGRSDAPQRYSDVDVVKMLEYLTDIFMELVDGYLNKQSTFLWEL